MQLDSQMKNYEGMQRVLSMHDMDNMVFRGFGGPIPFRNRIPFNYYVTTQIWKIYKNFSSISLQFSKYVS